MKHSDFDDVGDAIREDRPLREAAAYRIRFGLEGLTFRHIDVPDPVPTGRQILASAGLDHRADYILFAYLDTGDFEDVRLDETFDLRGKGAERFIAQVRPRLQVQVERPPVGLGPRRHAG